MNANVMTMIWPGRALGVALLIPGLASLTLFISQSIWPLVVALDVAVGLAAVVDLITLIGAAPIARGTPGQWRLLAQRARAGQSGGGKHGSGSAEPAVAR